MTAGGVMPDRSLEQRMDALDRANAIRSARSAFKRVLKDAGNVEARYRAAEMIALDEPASEFASMKVWDLLMAVPGLGRTKVNRLSLVARVSPSTTLAGMSWRQRETLVELLTDGLASSSARSAETERVG